MTPSLRILDCGPMTSLQDFGRPGLARLGIPQSGGMDPRALRLANALVGNAAGEAAIELVLAGLQVRAEGGDVHLALAGAPARLAIDGEQVAHHRSLLLEEGQTLSIGTAEAGVYMMLAVAGGFAIDKVLASRSLYARGGIGGLDGRRLEAGDLLAIRHRSQQPRRDLASDPISLTGDTAIRVMIGPHAEMFSHSSIDALLSQPFRVGHASDRMAYRLDGPRLGHDDSRDLPSQGTMPGGIQVPPDGQPLVLMADCQTIGGYPRIACVASVDLPRLAQHRAGETVRFTAISIDESARLSRLAHTHQFRLRGASPRARTRELCTRLMLTADAAVSAHDCTTWDCL